MRSVHPAVWFVGGVIGMGLASSWPAHADPPVASRCMTLVMAPVSEKKSLEAVADDPTRVSVSFANVARVAERWIDEQAGAGRVHLSMSSLSSAPSTNATLLCAW